MDGAALSPEDAITEQVTYWLGENLKNAELTVDHAGQPIDVRVSLTGNEAHVAFRSDRAQTRELLDASMDQLRELLHGEGLVLSGMSVDAQAAGQQGESGSDRSPGRERTEEVSVSVGEPLMPTRRILTDRSVDLFV
ncbi:flagellar hook-length control protein FliK [Simplicispira suum]|uniref:Flagellar hook-length control protein FliK n=2 Tax=Simplicispira suum TaxID=2109915 RepID=A0A2S0N5F5_9BURK|nr:flagellar hook-length control protein FliK [Simplicispira suum]